MPLSILLSALAPRLERFTVKLFKLHFDATTFQVTRAAPRSVGGSYYAHLSVRNPDAALSYVGATKRERAALLRYLGLTD